MHFLTLQLLFGVAHAVLVPSPPGPYSVTVHHFELVDPDRIDPFAPEANTTRRFMASAYLPIDAAYDCKAQVVPYMPPLTASVYGQVGEELGIPQGIIEEFEMEFCNISTVDLGETHSNETREFPVTVFSPGFGGTRFVYSALARSMSSLGHIVITVDPTFEAAVVEFPDGFVAYAQPSAASDPALTDLELAVSTRSILLRQD
jgi:hypothetical protein